MALAIVQCKLCKAPFQSLGGDTCPKCLQQIEDDFMVIKDYMYDNPGRHSVDSLHEATEVSREVIMHLIRDDRLTMGEVVQGSGTVCSNCKVPIPGGGLCPACKDALAKTLSGNVSGGAAASASKKGKAADEKQTPKMSVLQRRKDR